MARRKPTIQQVKAKHEGRLLHIEGVEGVGIGEVAAGPVIKVYVSKKTRALAGKIPARLGGYPVRIEFTGKFTALAE